MPQQTSLFGNLPQPIQPDKSKTKELVQKAGKTKSAPKTVSTTGAGGRQMTKIRAAVEMARQKLKPDSRLALMTDVAEFKQYMRRLRDAGIAALDTETNGLDPIMNQVVGTGLYTPGEKAIYIPHLHTDYRGVKLQDQIPYEVIQEELDKVASIDWIFHHAKFDCRFVRNSFGVRLKPFWDTQLASNFLNENEPHHLKDLHAKYVGSEAIHFDDLFGDIPQYFSYVPPEIGYLYAAGDPLKTFELFEFQRPFLNPDDPLCAAKGLVDAATLFRDIEMPLIPILADMEDEGITIDTEYANKLSVKYTEKLDEYGAKCHEFLSTLDYGKLAPDKRVKLDNPVNISSPTQLAIVMYDLLGLESPVEAKPRGTGEEILMHFRINTPYGNFFHDILEYRTVAKLLSTYIEKMPGIVKPKTGRLHGQFNQYGAKTGRYSSSDPNLQNIPSKNKEIRKMFTAKPGHVLISADYSQQEPRVLAHLCYTLFHDERMMQAYRESKDLYSWMASVIYEEDYDACKEKWPDGTDNPQGKERRDSVKSIILGLMYGRGASAIAEQLGWTKERAKQVVDMFFDEFPAVKSVVDYFQNHAREHGFVQTVWGRKRRLPDIQLNEFEILYSNNNQPVEEGIYQYFYKQLHNASNAKKNSVKFKAKEQGIKIIDNGGKICDAERQCLNSVVQGTSADITKAAMKALGYNEEFKSLGAQMLLTVHDEVIAQVPRENAARVSQLMRQVMIEAAASKILVPMKVDVEVTERWYGEEVEV